MKRIVLLTLLAATAAFTQAANWPQWRGPNFNGTTDASGLPQTFSKTENIAWTADMPGPGSATPIVWGDHVFVSSIDDATKSRVAICLDRKTGKVRWQKEVGPGASQDDRSNYASPSPATDGKLVFFFYGNGDLAAYDFEGKQVWTRNLQKDYGQFAFLWTFSTSPLLHDGKLYLQVLQRDVPVNGRGNRSGPNESYLLALDPQTGKELWKVSRPSEAVAESRESFTTPVPHTHNGRAEILVVGGDDITGHDAKTGKELWRWGTWNERRIGHWRLVPSPVAGAGVALACGPKGSEITAVKLGLNGKLDDSAIAWKSVERDVSSDVSTPAFYKGKFYILNTDKRKLFCVEPKDGSVIWSGDLDTRVKFESSPTAADDKLYMMDHRGNVFVVSAKTDGFNVLHKAAMGDEGDNNLRSTIAVSHGQLFIRTGKKLYCVGKKES